MNFLQNIIPVVIFTYKNIKLELSKNQ